MSAFLDACLAFPTVIYTILLAVAVVYWLFVVVGALDIDLFHIGADGAADGIAEGAAHGITEGSAEGAAESAGDGLVDHAGHAHGLAGFLSALRLRSAPLTVVLTSIILLAFSFSFLGMHYLGGLLPDALLKPLVGVGAFALALPLTSLVVRPLAPIFKPQSGRRRAELIGQTCTITTGRVDWRFGQADATLGQDHLLIQVRCDPAKQLGRRREALIIDYDPKREAYVVEPLDRET